MFVFGNSNGDFCLKGAEISLDVRAAPIFLFIFVLFFTFEFTNAFAYVMLIWYLSGGRIFIINLFHLMLLRHKIKGRRLIS